MRANGRANLFSFTFIILNVFGEKIKKTVILYICNLIKTWENSNEVNLKRSHVRVRGLAFAKTVTKLLFP